MKNRTSVFIFIFENERTFSLFGAALFYGICRLPLAVCRLPFGLCLDRPRFFR
ncbi:MAG: hypothetical protein RBQ94_00065 [Methanimicrococcus sp.]|nr:hypothetical protein [Methanimicrococcus sp.]